MQIKPVAIRMVMGRDKVHVVMRSKESQHLLKLTGQIEIVVLRKIDNLCITLGEQDFNLLGERSAIPCPVESHDHQIVRIDISMEQCFVLTWAAVQQHPYFCPERAKGFLQGPETHLRKQVLVIAKRQAPGWF